MNTRRRITSLAILAALCVAAAAPAAQAQAQDDPLRALLPPQAREVERPPLLINYALVFLLVAAAVGANAIPSKRGHQD